MPLVAQELPKKVLGKYSDGDGLLFELLVVERAIGFLKCNTGASAESMRWVSTLT